MTERTSVDPRELRILTREELTPVTGTLPWEENPIDDEAVE